MTRIETAGLLALTLALAAGMVLPAGAVSGPATLEQTDGEQPSVENVSAAVGQQLSTVLSTTTTEVRSEADEAGFEKRFNESNSTERGEAIAERADELENRAAELRDDYEATTEAYRNGEIEASTFAQRLASLTATANTVEGSADSLADRAAEIPDAERRALGITDSAFELIYDEIDPVSGRTTGAILSQFTAQDRGEIEIESDDGISIEVTSEDDGQSRQFERPRDGDGSYELNQSEALDIATDALSAPNGEWVLTGVETDDGAYEFEFALDGPGEGEAEVSVDGATGTVFELEESIEAEDDDDEDDDDESELERLVITVTEGEPAPGENVTLTVTGAGEPVENATVELNDETVGQTDANGTISVSIPSEEAEFEVTDGEAEGELKFEFEEDEDREEELGATANIENGTVTVSVVLNGDPVEGATVTANGDSVGTTGADGTVSFDLPTDDELEIDIEDGEREAELEYELDDGEDDSDEDENERDEEEDDEEENDEEENEEEDDEHEDGDGEAGDSDDSSDDEDSETESEEAAEETDEESDDSEADGEDEVDDDDGEQADEEEEDDDTEADDDEDDE